MRKLNSNSIARVLLYDYSNQNLIIKATFINTPKSLPGQEVILASL